jgi:predicted permease
VGQIRFTHAWRALFSTKGAPFVTIVAIVSLALGIGANAAIFSIFNQILLRPMPVQEPDRLVNLSAPGPKPGSNTCNQAGGCTEVFSYPMFRDLERVQKVFTGIAAHRTFSANIAARDQTMSTEGMLVSGGYFRVLGLKPAIGRLLNSGDDQAVGQSLVVVLSHGFWQTRFDASPSVLNDTIVVNGQRLTIVGVAPRGFEGTTLGSHPDVFVPITLRGLMSPGFDRFHVRRAYWAYLFARLRPQVSIEQARASLQVQYSAILNDVEAKLQTGVSDQMMARFRKRTIGVEPGGRGQSSVHREASPPLRILLGVTTLVLIIACANIANLLLARSAARAGEMAVRLSIGASRRQLVAQLLAESCLLALFGGVAGLVVAAWTLRVIQWMLPPEPARTIQAGLDPTVLGFAAVLTIGTGLLFGLFPALHASRPDLQSILKGQAGQPSGARAAARFRLSLATAQIALSMALLIAAGLFTRSLMNVSRVDLGIRIDNLVTFGVSPELNAYTPERSRLFFERLEEELAAIPGVTGVTTSLVPAIAGSNWGTDVSVEGFKEDFDTDDNSQYNEVGAGYFRTMGIPLIAGREFTPRDGSGTPKVAIVNEAFAKKFGLGRDAVGKRMGHEGENEKLDTEIIGLVQNAKYSDVKLEIPPLFFMPYRQDDELGSMNFYVRTSQEPEASMASIRKAVARLDPNLPLEELKTMPEQVRENVFLDRFISVLSAAFAILATVLAAIGLYGVLAYTVTQRTREIGLRMALGAAPGRVRGMLLKQVGVMTLIGGSIGLVGAFFLGRLAESLLYQLKGRDPLVLTVAAVVLTLVALAAGFIPAHRASKVDPMWALRYE